MGQRIMINFLTQKIMIQQIRMSQRTSNQYFGHRYNRSKWIVSLVFIFFVLLKDECVCSTGVGTQYVPIPSSPLGISIGNHSENASIIMELVYDPLCHDTQKFDQNVFRKLQEQLPLDIKSNIHFKLFLQPLPYHTTAMKVVQGLLFVADNSKSTLPVFRYFLDNIDDWSVEHLANITIEDYMNQLAFKISELTQIEKAKIREALNHESSYDLKARVLFKNLVGSQRCGGTPSIFVNNAKVDGATNMSVEEWISFLKKLNS